MKCRSHLKSNGAVREINLCVINEAMVDMLQPFVPDEEACIEVQMRMMEE